VNAIFFGGALATEVELAIDLHGHPTMITELRGA